MPSISKRDRDALLRVVKDRFDLLERELAAREHMLSVEIARQIEAENKNTLDHFKRELKKLRDREVKLSADIRDLRLEADKAGVMLMGVSRDYLGDNVRVEMQDQNNEVRKRITDIKIERGLLNGSLYEKKLELTEQLLLMSLETKEAAEFMASIPRIDDLLPMPAKPELTS